MPEEQLQNQETPVEEMPSEAVVPEEKTEDVEGTPAESTPEAEKSEQPQKTEEQLIEDRKFFQTKSQDALAELTELKKMGEQPSGGQQVPQRPQQQQSPRQQQPPNGNADLDEYLQQPSNMLFAMNQIVQNAMTTQRQEMQTESEMRESKRIFNSFCASTNVTREEVEAASKEIETMGLVGSNMRPTVTTALMMKEIQMQRLTNSGREVVTEAAAQAASAVKNQLLTEQPDGGAPPPEQPKTQGDIIADKFEKSDKNKALDDLISGLEQKG